ncbi:MAG: GNAT family N-acetyltransferase [Myxococcales bacterium]|nr:GNAT family N-acetyltransferase [Myxococcales bacterium]
MDDSELLRRIHECLLAEIEFWGKGSATGSVFRAPGVVAAVTPATPDRSIFNSVAPDDLGSLEACYDLLVRSYREAGVRAFTVWVPPANSALERFLEARGHVLDGRPAAMAAPMSEIEIPEPGDLEWEETRDISIVARLNDAAYGFPPPAFEAAVTRWPHSPGWYGYLGRREGRAVSCVLAYESADGDCSISGVASLPDARGRGIAGRLMGRALARARERGATSTSLQASPKGKSVYAKLGYRDLGGMSLWEHRTPA